MQPSKTPGRGKRHQIIVAVIALVALLLPAVPAKAVLNGDLDSTNEYSSVGIVYAGQTFKCGGWPDVAGTDLNNGVLIAPDIVLIHPDTLNDLHDRCGVAYVSFEPDYDLPEDYPDDCKGPPDDECSTLEAEVYAGDYSPEAPNFPDYNPCEAADEPEERCYRGTLIFPTQGRGFTGHGTSEEVPKSFGLLKLDEPVPANIATPAELTVLGALDDLAVNDVLTTVGYGPKGANCFEEGDVGWCESEMTRSVGEIEIDAVKKSELLVSAVDGAAEPQLPCWDGGGGNFDAAGTLVALTHLNECQFDFADDAVIAQKQVSLQRLDTKLVQRYLCEFAELGNQPLCGGSEVSALSKAASADDDGAGVERKAKKGGKHKGKGKGKRGR